MIWSDEYLNRVWLEGEIEVARETKCIVDRLSIATTIGIAEYSLPDYVFNVRKVYWKGIRLDPINYLDKNLGGYDVVTYTDGAFNPIAFTSAYLLGQQNSQSISGSGATGGKPFEYYYYGFGENIIRINPSADEQLDFYNDNLWNANGNIDRALIVEFYRFPDSNAGYEIPNYIRRRTIKAYVCWKAFAREGDGQNLNAADYWQKHYFILLQRASKIINNIKRSYIPVAPSIEGYTQYDWNEDYGSQGPYKPPRGVLPANYGIALDDVD